MPCQFSEMVLGASSIFSPDSKFIAITSGSRLTVRETDTMEILHVFSCIDKVEKVVFSPDSQYVLCGMFSRNAVQIFSIADGEWRCRINEGVAGIVQSSWCPDSRGIVTESDFGLQLGVWNLTDSSSQTIASPKANIKTSPPVLLDSSPCSSNKTARLSAFSDCETFYAVVLRNNAQDQIGVYTCSPCSPWGQASRFKCKSSDVAAICWSPCSRHIVTTDSALSYNFHIYDLHGQLISTYEAYKHALGIRSCVFHRLPRRRHTSQFVKFNYNEGIVQKNPTIHITHANANQSLSQLAREAEAKNSLDALPANLYERTLGKEAIRAAPLVAIGSFDGRIRLISTISWKCAQVLPLVHPNLMEPGLALGTECTVELTESQAKKNRSNHSDGGEKEVDDAEQHVMHEQALIFNMSAAKAAKMSMKTRGVCYAKCEIKELPQRSERKGGLQTSANAPSKGVVWNGWSADGTLLAARDASHPQCLWVWDALQAQLVAMLVQLDSVTCARWRPLVSYESKEGHTAVDSASVLAYCCGSSRVYFWSSEGGPSWADLPHNKETGVAIVVNSMQWSNDGNRLLLQGSEGLCTAAVFIDKNGICGGVIEKPKKLSLAMEAGEDGL